MTQAEAEKLLQTATRLWLSGWYLLKDTAACLRDCNGVGAAWMPKFVRKFLDFLLKLFAPAVAIHDRRYSRNLGDRHKWDDEFYTNCRILARDEYSWYHPLRYLAYFVAGRLRAALTVAGEIAWIQAAKEKK